MVEWSLGYAKGAPRPLKPASLPQLLLYIIIERGNAVSAGPRSGSIDLLALPLGNGMLLQATDFVLYSLMFPVCDWTQAKLFPAAT